MYTLITGAGGGLANQIIKNIPGEYIALSHSNNPIILSDTKNNNLIQFSVDLTSLESIKTLVDKLSGYKINSIIHCAGKYQTAPLFSTPISEIENIMYVNIIGPIYLTQLLLPQLDVESKILFMGSDSSFISLPYTIPYSMSKFSTDALVEALRIELQPFKIYVSMIVAGNFDTGLLEKSLEKLKQYSPNLPDRFQKEFELIRDKLLSSESSGFKSPRDIIQCIYNWKNDSKPKKYYTCMNNEEHEYLLTSILEKFAYLNNNQFDKERILSEIEFIINL